MSAFSEFSQFTYLARQAGSVLEPKKSNRFVVYISQIPTIPMTNKQNEYTRDSLLISLQSIKRPTYSVSNQKIPNFNNEIMLAGKVTTEKSFNCKFVDFIGNHKEQGNNDYQVDTISAIIYRWYSLVNNVDLETVGYKDYYTTNLDLYLLAPTGHTIEKWKYYNVWPGSVNFGELAYSDAKNLEIDVTFYYDNAKMIYVKTSEETKNSDGDHTYLSLANILGNILTLEKSDDNNETLLSENTKISSNYSYVNGTNFSGGRSRYLNESETAQQNPKEVTFHAKKDISGYGSFNEEGNRLTPSVERSRPTEKKSGEVLSNLFFTPRNNISGK
jgi:hypothetical protein